MGRRGPIPKSPERKRVEGNPGKRAIKEPIKTRKGKVTCPAWLGVEARREWQRLAPELEELGLLTTLDAAAFAIYCDSLASWLGCDRFLREKGDTYVTAGGKVAPRPEVQIAHNYALAVREWGAEFGLTPSARARLSIPFQTQSEEDEFEGWLNARR